MYPVKLKDIDLNLGLLTIFGLQTCLGRVNKNFDQ